jgi:hypothetical protein
LLIREKTGVNHPTIYATGNGKGSGAIAFQRDARTMGMLFVTKNNPFFRTFCADTAAIVKWIPSQFDHCLSL